MPSPTPKDRLQPSLLDRLEDGLAPTLSRLGEARALLGRVLDLEGARRLELRRTVVLSAQELRRSVLRDLQSLLNTTAAEEEPGDGEESALSRHPAAQASVLNYGIPALAGRVRTLDDFAELAQRIERAIERHEPRLRHVRVRPAESGAAGANALTSPLDLVIEGELWGHPLPEHLLVRTPLALAAARGEVAGPERPA